MKKSVGRPGTVARPCRSVTQLLLDLSLARLLLTVTGTLLGPVRASARACTRCWLLVVALRRALLRALGWIAAPLPHHSSLRHYWLGHDPRRWHLAAGGAAAGGIPLGGAALAARELGPDRLHAALEICEGAGDKQTSCSSAVLEERTCTPACHSRAPPSALPCSWPASSLGRRSSRTLCAGFARRGDTAEAAAAS